MAQKRQGRQKDRPREIPMTDLESMESGREERTGDVDIHAAGTPGGGTAYGGLAGTNIGDGSPENADLEDALGSGIGDNDEEQEEPTEAYGSSEGSAVGGTPAGGRARGGDARDGVGPRGSRRGGRPPRRQPSRRQHARQQAHGSTLEPEMQVGPACRAGQVPRGWRQPPAVPQAAYLIWRVARGTERFHAIEGATS